MEKPESLVERTGKLLDNLIRMSLISLVSVFAGGCFCDCEQGIVKPRIRPSPYFGKIDGIGYPRIEDIGKHSYDFSLFENNGLFYSSKAGYIDLGHLRDSADRTRYIYQLAYKAIDSGSEEFSFTVGEPARYHVKLVYPDNWDITVEGEKREIAQELSIEMGRYAGFISTVWHEIITWYGWKCTGVFSEKHSAFSWEDLYSDCVGSRIVAKVLREGGDYDSAMTAAIKEELQRLDVQEPAVARAATEKIKGKWFSGIYPFIKMYKRNFDIGREDGTITPFIVKGIGADDAHEACPVPQLDNLRKYGFVMELQLEPRELEKRIIYKILGKSNNDGIDPDADFPILIRQIKTEVIQDAGEDVEKTELQ